LKLKSSIIKKVRLDNISKVKKSTGTKIHLFIIIITC